MGFATTVLGTMKFFRRKDKRRNEGASHQGRMPGFGSSSSTTNGKHLAPAHGGYGLGFGVSRPDGHRTFGSTPSGPYHRGTDAQSDLLPNRPTRASAAALAQLPAAILQRIFTFVCPHSADESYTTCEQSSVDDCCALCDLRDLAHCVAVCRRWKAEAVKLLYHSIRIDSVHYCDLEAVLAERRKRRSFFDRNGQPEDPAQARLKLLCRTLREDPVRRGRLVQFFKMPYMLRESCQADLARTIAVTPDLRYVDLPEGLFADEPSFLTLRLEVQARCLELRKMTYMGGSENSLRAIASGRVWTKLEVLELIRIEMEPAMLRQVLSYLGNLRALKVSQTKSFSDETLEWNDMMPPFPPLEEFILTDVPNVTSEGLKGWLVQPEARQSLRVLTLNGTGVRAWTLQELLAYLPGLKHLSLMDSVSASMASAAGSHNIPPLVSTSLESLHFEITAAPSSPKYSGVAASYYNYLAGSLLSGGLPNLRAVYVRDPNFPDLLLGLPPPAPAFAEGPNGFPGGSLLPPSAPFAGGNLGHRSQGSLSSLNGAFSPASGLGVGTATTTNPRFSSNNPFATAAAAVSSPHLSPPGAPPLANFLNLPAKLEVFTKGDDDQLGWSFVQVGSGRGSGAAHERQERPLSSYGLGADVLGGSAAGWSSGAGARRSVLVGGAGAGGGFLAVPTGDERGGGGAQTRGRNSSLARGSKTSLGGYVGGGGEDEWPRPKSSAGEKKWERLDLWR
ncbi:cdb6b678-2657-4042-8f7d-9551dec2c000 [Thermothielavioides terrestris]|uniref:Cdb6b678-2657-4042-8f7d-9551dec2c000 n=1 Tax=Thermothielavioides terrestris TaxID=2587410 RepID=A0A3S4B4L6_9PEZI|nr:cdb6b678-2657-4042-8f7d-9551dec2c000 [Thermothielavioides terrestris]